jgi:hypothetical protein
MTLASIVSLAAQLPPTSPQPDGETTRFIILESGQEDQQSGQMLRLLSDLIPHHTRVASPKGLAEVLGELAALIPARQASDDPNSPPCFLIIFDLQRFRDLRRQEDDFSFSRRDPNEPVPPSKSFATIVRDGPAVGIHTIIWCDSLNNANRTFDRQTLREFEMRILFQMSAADSSNLIDSPLASKLGPMRAYFSSEEQGKLEKFRPYGVPDPSWFEELNTRLKRLWST